MGDRRFGWVWSGFVVAVLWSALVRPAHAEAELPPSRLAAIGEATLFSSASAEDNAGDDSSTPSAAPPPSANDGPSMEPDEDPFGQGSATEQADIAPGSESDFSPGAAGGLDGNVADPGIGDGTDPSVTVRNPDGIASLDNPQSGFDPLLFQIEDLNPIVDNRTTRRLFRQEPYDPVGIRVGSFVLFPELVLGGSYYSNVFHAPAARSDIALDVQPSARLVSNWSRHALEFTALGTFSYYDQFTTENAEDYLLESRGRLDITRRANVQALVSRQQVLEDRSALDASSVGTRAEVRLDRAEAAYNQRFNRLSLQLRGSISDYSYGPTEDAGVITDNRDRDYTAYEQAGRATWDFKPSFSPFVEVAFNQRSYGEAAQTDLINRTSNGQRYRFGISFGNTGQILRGEVSLGYGIQTPEDARLHSVDGLIVDANATWRVTELTSILFNASSDVSETTTAGVGGAFYRSASVEVRHQLRRYLIASAGLSYSNQNSQDGIINDNQLRETLGIEYFADRDTVLFGRYAHVNFDGVGVPNDYVGDEVHLGVRLRR